MPVTQPQSRRIRILRDEVFRKIAAGEVIDRPFSIVRELLDNAIDAGAGAIDVSLEAGGLARVRVVDDGSGMRPEDLALCWQAHATSKIETEDDLLRVSSLGFRGEALSSIAICSRLVVVSCPGRQEPAYRLEVQGGRQVGFEVCQGKPGTQVEVSELFYNYPARKKFLRSVSAESGLCRAVLIDRAVAHAGISFRLFSDKELRLSLPAGGPLDRIAGAYAQHLDQRLLERGGLEREGFSVEVVAGRPELRRRDRKLVQVFVNGRRVSEFALLQAAGYGFEGYLPGGWHPVAFVFVKIDPALVDFNIHPAKKEVRFRNLPEVHKTVVAAIRALLEPRAVGPVPATAAMRGNQRGTEPVGHGIPAASAPKRWPELSSRLPADLSAAQAESRIRFLGQVFGVFLVFEVPGRLLVLDQHAAHERIIFDRLGARAPELQEMLFPLSFDVSADEDRRIQEAREQLAEIGIAVKRVGGRAFEVTALSADFHALPEEALVELVRSAGGGEWRDSLRATAACRLALKEGDPVDPVTASELCARALELPVPRCPHGRPIWHELSEESLRRLVDRPPPGGGA